MDHMICDLIKITLDLGSVFLFYMLITAQSLNVTIYVRAVKFLIILVMSLFSLAM